MTSLIGNSPMSWPQQPSAGRRRLLVDARSRRSHLTPAVGATTQRVREGAVRFAPRTPVGLPLLPYCVVLAGASLPWKHIGNLCVPEAGWHGVRGMSAGGDRSAAQPEQMHGIRRKPPVRHPAGPVESPIQLGLIALQRAAGNAAVTRLCATIVCNIEAKYFPCRYDRAVSSGQCISRFH
jgi:hypothetical protein